MPSQRRPKTLVSRIIIIHGARYFTVYRNRVIRFDEQEISREEEERQEGWMLTIGLGRWWILIFDLGQKIISSARGLLLLELGNFTSICNRFRACEEFFSMKGAEEWKEEWDIDF